MVNLETYYLFPNLSDDNNVFRYSPGFIEVSGRGDEDDSTRQRQWVAVQIPEASYDLIDIAETIKIAMKRNGHNDESIKITANTNTLKNVLEIQGDFQVDFRARNSVSSVLGFRNQLYKEGIHESQNVVNILSIKSILVNVDESFLNVIEKHFSKKIQKHEKQKTLIESKINSIRNMVSKALSNNEISEDEFEKILFETEKYRKKVETYRGFDEANLEFDKMPKKSESFV